MICQSLLLSGYFDVLVKMYDSIFSSVVGVSTDKIVFSAVLLPK